jgi:Protein of unknown function (DUF1353)
MTDSEVRRSGFESGAPLALNQTSLTSWDTTDWLRYRDRRGNLWEVEPGSSTDLGSGPSLLDWFVSRTFGAPAYVLHDRFYRYWILQGLATYAQADRILREALADLGVPAPRCWLAWGGVRLASIFTRPGGRRGCARDLPALVAVTIPGLLLASPALLALPFWALLKAADYLSSELQPTRAEETP